MADPRFESYDTMIAYVLECYDKADHQEALDTVVSEAKFYPNNAGFLLFIRAALTARVGQSEQAFQVLEQMLDSGYWLSQRFWEDEDFDDLRDLPEFKRLHARSNEFLAAAWAAATPELLTILPKDYHDRQSLSLLLAIHGNGSSVRWHRAHWQTAADTGWLVGMPQSTQASGLDSEGGGAFVWDDAETAITEISGHFKALNKAYPVDEEQVVVAGFSRGAEMAIQLAITGTLPVKGVIGVCPGGPLTRDLSLWEAIVSKATQTSLKAHIIIGEQDDYGQGGKQLVDMLRGTGLSVELETHPEMGHDYPADFKARLGDLLSTVV